jgi:hypothetical protein
VRVYAPALDEVVTVKREDGTEGEHRLGLVALPYSGRAESPYANANLIAAAPDLLAALQIAEELLERNGITRPEITAALAKADGAGVLTPKGRS